MSRNTPQWIMNLIDKCNNVFDMAKWVGSLVLSKTNINKAMNPQETEAKNPGITT